MVYPEGAQMLTTHGDVIDCESIWGSTVDGDHLLTVVVVDEDNKLQLAATSLTTAECKNSWTSFFTFIKACVPLFNPSVLLVMELLTLLNLAGLEVGSNLFM